MDVSTLVTALGQTLDPALRQQAEKLLEEVSVLIGAHQHVVRRVWYKGLLWCIESKPLKGMTFRYCYWSIQIVVSRVNHCNDT